MERCSIGKLQELCNWGCTRVVISRGAKCVRVAVTESGTTTPDTINGLDEGAPLAFVTPAVFPAGYPQHRVLGRVFSPVQKLQELCAHGRASTAGPARGTEAHAPPARDGPASPVPLSQTSAGQQAGETEGRAGVPEEPDS